MLWQCSLSHSSECAPCPRRSRALRARWDFCMRMWSCMYGPYLPCSTTYNDVITGWLWTLSFTLLNEDLLPEFGWESPKRHSLHDTQKRQVTQLLRICWHFRPSDGLSIAHLHTSTFSAQEHHNQLCRSPWRWMEDRSISFSPGLTFLQCRRDTCIYFVYWHFEFVERRTDTRILWMFRHLKTPNTAMILYIVVTGDGGVS